MYNIGAAKAVAVSDILASLLQQSSTDIAVTQDPERMRPSDIPRIVADCSLLRATTGWEPRIPLERTLSDTLDYWRTRP